MNRRRLGQAGASLAAIAALAATALTAPSAHAADGSGDTSYYTAVASCAKATTGKARCFALRREAASKNTPGAVAVKGLAAGVDAGPAGGFTPGDLAQVYGLNSNAATTGQVVGIVDAYDNPNALADLNAFDAHYGLPAETASSFVKVDQRGGTTYPTPDEGWAGEIALDLQAVRGLCHTCKILLVEADDNNLDSLAAGVNTAVRLGATEVSNSYGGAEGTSKGDARNDETLAQYQAAYNHPGVVITASTGDEGYYDWNNSFDGDTPVNSPSSPASYNTVVATAGTTLQLNDDGSRASETVWNSNGLYAIVAAARQASVFASGGGCSTEFNAQLWQTATPGWAQTACGTKRLEGDVAAVGDPYTGYDVYNTYTPSDPSAAGWGTFGGTSLSSPLIAAMYALAGGSHGLAYPALSLYGHQGTSALYDVTSGGDGLCDGGTPAECDTLSKRRFGDSPNLFGAGVTDCAWLPNSDTRSAGTRACDAATGYDGASGVGTPNGTAAFTPATAALTIKVKRQHNLIAGRKATLKGSAIDPNPGATISSYIWSVTRKGHSKHLTGATVKTKFKKAGRYSITLTVIDSYGISSSQTVTVKVKPRKKHHRHHGHHHA